MNLHGIVFGAVATINPVVDVTLQSSAGYITNADGTRTPQYSKPVKMKGQRQALQYNDLLQIDGLNLQGERCKFYLFGNWHGIVRAENRGGDLITEDNNGRVWLVALVAEDWSEQDGWMSVICTLQNNA